MPKAAPGSRVGYEGAKQTLAAHSEYEEGKPEGRGQALPHEGIAGSAVHDAAGDAYAHELAGCERRVHAGRSGRRFHDHFGVSRSLAACDWRARLIFLAKDLMYTAVACLMPPTSRRGQAAASCRHRHRNRRGAAGARRWPPTHAWMLHFKT